MFGNAAWIVRRARSIRRRFVPDVWQTDDWENLGTDRRSTEPRRPNAALRR